jgi:hypothetical protein
MILLMEEELYRKVERIETRVDEHEKKLNNQLEKNDTLIELKTLVSIQVEESKKRDIQMEKFSDTLDRVNDNLTNLNISHNQMKQDMSEIGNRVNDIEKYQEESKIDPLQLFKNLIGYVFSIVGGIIVAILYMKLGL